MINSWNQQLLLTRPFPSPAANLLSLHVYENFHMQKVTKAWQCVCERDCMRVWERERKTVGVRVCVCIVDKRLDSAYLQWEFCFKCATPIGDFLIILRSTFLWYDALPWEHTQQMHAHTHTHRPIKCPVWPGGKEVKNLRISWGKATAPYLKKNPHAVVDVAGLIFRRIQCSSNYQEIPTQNRSCGDGAICNMPSLQQLGGLLFSVWLHQISSCLENLTKCLTRYYFWLSNHCLDHCPFWLSH